MIRSGETDFGPAAAAPTRRCAALGLVAGAVLPASPSLVWVQPPPPASNAPAPAPPSGAQSQGASETLKTGRDTSDRMTVPVMLNGKGPFAFFVELGR